VGLELGSDLGRFAAGPHVHSDLAGHASEIVLYRIKAILKLLFRPAASGFSRYFIGQNYRESGSRFCLRTCK
ncbi:MAG: hypothetical protein WCR33_05055, partial [Bacilli bacterium]